MKFYLPLNILTTSIAIFFSTNPALAVDVSEVFCSCTYPATPTSRNSIDTEILLKNKCATAQPTIKQTNNTSQNDAFPWNMYLPAITIPQEEVCIGWQTDSDKWIYYFDDIIRIGDDIDFNENHPGQEFCISSAYSITYSAEFILPSECEYSAATMKYYATGVYGDNKIFINGKLVDTTCHTGNTAGAGKCCTNGDITITNDLHAGTNKIYIETILFPGDLYTPYDDIELYRLQIALTKKK